MRGGSKKKNELVNDDGRLFSFFHPGVGEKRI
jgi:hypothetical protein